VTQIELEQKINTLESMLGKVLEILQNGGVFSVPVLPCKFTFHTWLDEWCAAYKKPSVKPATLNTLDVVLRVHIKPNFPNVPLNLVTGIELQKFLAGMKAGRTRKAVFDVLKESFKTAQGLKLITDNPMLAVKIPPHVQEKGEALNEKEIAAFLAAIKGHKTEHYFKYLLYTGCRRNEGLNLNKSDIDYKNRLIHIHGTKTDGSDRILPLFNNVAALLNRNRPDKDGFYFRFRPDYLTHVFKKFCPEHKLHDLRHTFATTCLKAKIPMKVVQKWLGHSKLDTTADIYSHVTDEVSRAEASVLNLYFMQKAVN